MKREISGEVIEQATQNVMDAIEGVGQLPTDNAQAFTEAFYGEDGEGNIAGDMATLIEAFGTQVEAKRQEAILYPDREQIQIRTDFSKAKHRFIATARSWGPDPDDRYREAILQASTKVTPFVTRERSVWGLKMRAENNSSSPQTYPMSPRMFDEAFMVRHQMWRKPAGLRSRPAYLIDEMQDEEGFAWGFEKFETPENLRAYLTQAKSNPAAEHTPDGIPILPSAETHRRLQLFVHNFFDLNLFLLASTGVPVAIDFVEEHQTSTGLRLVQ